MKLEFSRQIREKYSYIKKILKIPAVEAELIHRVVPPSCSTELFHRVVPTGCSTELIHRVVPPSCSNGLFHRVVPPSCSTVLFHRVVPRRTDRPDEATCNSPSLRLCERAEKPLITFSEKMINKVNYHIVAYSIVGYKSAAQYAVSRITKFLK
jgi:hypothetical protein